MRILCYPIAITLCVISLSVVNDNARQFEWNSYLEYNKYRVSYQDYKHPSFGESAELYNSVGWSKDFCKLVDRIYFMDERFSKEALSRLVSPFSRTTSAEGFDLIVMCEMLIKLLRREPTARMHVLFMLMLFILVFIYWFLTRSKEAIRFFVVMCLISIAALTLLFYLAWRGRLPLRAEEVVVLPLLFLVVEMACEMVSHAELGRIREAAISHGRSSRVFPVVLLCCMLVGIAFLPHQIDRYVSTLRLNVSSRIECIRRFRSMEAYAMVNPNVLFIYGQNSQNYAADTLYPNKKPTNVILWGSSYCRTPVWHRQIALYGFDDLRSEDFTRENIRFIDEKRATGRREVKTLFNMLKNDYGVMSCEREAAFDGVHVVARFSK